jgi:hypothetical protein
MSQPAKVAIPWLNHTAFSFAARFRFCAPCGMPSSSPRGDVGGVGEHKAELIFSDPFSAPLFDIVKGVFSAHAALAVPHIVN